MQLIEITNYVAFVTIIFNGNIFNSIEFFDEIPANKGAINLC